MEWFEDPKFYYLVTELHGSEWSKESSIPKELLPSTGNRQKRSSMDLFECIDVHERFPEQLAKVVLRQVADACYYLHETLGVVHRDIKDENVVIDKMYRVKLIDFGAVAMIPAVLALTVRDEDE